MFKRIHLFFLFAVLFAASNALAFEELSRGEAKVTIGLKFVKVLMQAVCVVRENREAELVGASIDYQFQDYLEFLKLQDQGYDRAVPEFGKQCDTDPDEQSSLRRVKVGEHATRDEVEKAIKKAGGYEKVTIIFYNEDNYNEAHGNSFRETISGIFSDR